MNILVILAHPHNKSFNYAIYETVLATLKDNGHSVISHDLYEENFDPLLKQEELNRSKLSADPVIAEHAKHLTWADGIILVHPTWWGQMPAILKGWVDRVVTEGIAYSYIQDETGKRKRIRLLKLKKAVVINTANSSEEREESLNYPLQNVWQKSIFKFLRVDDFNRKTFRIISESTLDERKSWLNDTRIYISGLFPED